MVSIINDLNCEASASEKTKSDGTNLPRDELINFIGEMFLFSKGNLQLNYKTFPCKA